MSSFPPDLAIAISNRAFEQWGLPQCIKIDNGRPLVNPSSPDLPTLAILWWVGLGIEVIQNRPRRPQENGAVESSQGILNRWVNPKEFNSLKALNRELFQKAQFQREVYMIPNKDYKTRMSLFPELAQSPRRYSPKNFDFQKVEAFLAQKAWIRKVKRNGEIKLFAQTIYLGTRFAAQSVSIIYDPHEHIWQVHDSKGALIKLSQKKLVRKEDIMVFANR